MIKGFARCAHGAVPKRFGATKARAQACARGPYKAQLEGDAPDHSCRTDHEGDGDEEEEPADAEQEAYDANYNMQMSNLASMGLLDARLNMYLLKKYAGNTERVVQDLFSGIHIIVPEDPAAAGPVEADVSEDTMGSSPALF